MSVGREDDWFGYGGSGILEEQTVDKKIYGSGLAGRLQILAGDW